MPNTPRNRRHPPPGLAPTSSRTARNASSSGLTTPELKARFENVARHYGLAVPRWFGERPGPIVYDVPPEKKADFLLAGLRRIDQPGVYLVVCHIGTDKPELAALRDLNPGAPAQMGERYLEALRAHADCIARNVTANLYDRHLKPIFVNKQ